MQKDLIGINKKIRLAGIAGAILAGFTLLQLFCRSQVFHRPLWYYSFYTRVRKLPGNLCRRSREKLGST